MSVYVDHLMEYGWVLRGHVVKSCHMYADTLDELHEMASKIGMKRSWFQNKASLPHYDLVASRRAAAISFGAIEHCRHRMANFMRSSPLSILHGRPPLELTHPCCGDKELGGATSLPKEENDEGERQGPAVQ